MQNFLFIVVQFRTAQKDYTSLKQCYAPILIYTVNNILVQQDMPLKFGFPEFFPSVAFFSYIFQIPAQDTCAGNTNSPFPTGCCGAAGTLPCITTGILLQGVLGKRETFCAFCDKYCVSIYIYILVHPTRILVYKLVILFCPSNHKCSTRPPVPSPPKSTCPNPTWVHGII